MICKTRTKAVARTRRCASSSLRGAKRRSNPVLHVWPWIASRSLSSGGHSPDPLARNDGAADPLPRGAAPGLAAAQHADAAFDAQRVRTAERDVADIAVA